MFHYCSRWWYHTYELLLHRNLRNTEKQTKFNYYSSFVVIPGAGVGALIPTTPTAQAGPVAFLGSNPEHLGYESQIAAPVFWLLRRVIEAGAFSDCVIPFFGGMQRRIYHPHGPWNGGAGEGFCYPAINLSGIFPVDLIGMLSGRVALNHALWKTSIFAWLNFQHKITWEHAPGGFFSLPLVQLRQIQLLEPISGALCHPRFHFIFHMYSTRARFELYGWCLFGLLHSHLGYDLFPKFWLRGRSFDRKSFS